MTGGGEMVSNSSLHRSNIAGKIAAFRRSERSALRTLIATVFEHLITLRASLAIDPRSGPMETIDGVRDDIERSLIDSPAYER